MKEVRLYLEERIGNYSFYFEDLKSGFIYGYNEHKKMTSAGCMKLPVSMVIMKKVEDKEINLTDMIIIKETDKVLGSGILKELDSREYSIEELIKIMLIESDNTATQKLVSIIGFDDLNKSFKSMGLKNTIMNDMPGSVINYTTSYDLSYCWKSLKSYSYLNEEHSKAIINILKSRQIVKKTAFYINENIKSRIANKPGDSHQVQNDTALIELQKGDFIFSIMSENLPNSVYGIVSLAKSGKMIWDGITLNWE